MDYTIRYGLEFNPFLKNSKEILVDTSEHKETRFRLDYLIKTKGFGLLTGSPGRGKTTALRGWANSLNPSLNLRDVGASNLKDNNKHRRRYIPHFLSSHCSVHTLTFHQRWLKHSSPYSDAS
ncbi:MAG: hypothetical protein ACK5ML_11270 [Lachnospiraceae bacterium]